jgi:hypothetical protein
MIKFSGVYRKWAAHAVAVTAVLGGTLLVAQGARADDVSDELARIKAHADCVSQCQRDSFSCMGGCANGQAGASCRAQCLLQSSNCSQSCP